MMGWPFNRAKALGVRDMSNSNFTSLRINTLRNIRTGNYRNQVRQDRNTKLRQHDESLEFDPQCAVLEERMLAHCKDLEDLADDIGNALVHTPTSDAESPFEQHNGVDQFETRFQGLSRNLRKIWDDAKALMHQYDGNPNVPGMSQKFRQLIKNIRAIYQYDSDVYSAMNNGDRISFLNGGSIRDKIRLLIGENTVNRAVPKAGKILDALGRLAPSHNPYDLSSNDAGQGHYLGASSAGHNSISLSNLSNPNFTSSQGNETAAAEVVGIADAGESVARSDHVEVYRGIQIRLTNNPIQGESHQAFVTCSSQPGPLHSRPFNMKNECPNAMVDFALFCGSILFVTTLIHFIRENKSRFKKGNKSCVKKENLDACYNQCKAEGAAAYKKMKSIEL
jgi:hypothetical protein